MAATVQCEEARLAGIEAIAWELEQAGAEEGQAWTAAIQIAGRAADIVDETGCTAAEAAARALAFAAAG